MSFLNHNRRRRRGIGLLCKNAGGGKRQAHKYPEEGACHERHAREKIYTEIHEKGRTTYASETITPSLSTRIPLTPMDESRFSEPHLKGQN